MQAYEFNSVIGNEGVIHIANETPRQNTGKHFSAIKLKTKGFKFDRETANE